MAETKHPEESITLPSKRKSCEDEINIAKPEKNQKLESQGNSDSEKSSERNRENLPSAKASRFENSKEDQEDQRIENSSVAEEKTPNRKREQDEDEDEVEDEEYYQEDEEAQTLVDRKGKGILIEDNEDESDEDDDSDDSDTQSEGESDLSDDPLAEVDLDNILPSRTRRRAVQPGVYIATDLPNDDDGDSDDSDA